MVVHGLVRYAAVPALLTPIAIPWLFLATAYICKWLDLLRCPKKAAQGSMYDAKLSEFCACLLSMPWQVQHRTWCPMRSNSTFAGSTFIARGVGQIIDAVVIAVDVLRQNRAKVEM